MRGSVVKGTAILRVPRAVDFADRANIPLAIDANVAKMMAFEAGFGVVWVVTMEWPVYRHSLYSPFSQDFVVQFCVLDSQFNGGCKRGRGGGGYNLRVGCHS